MVSKKKTKCIFFAIASGSYLSTIVFTALVEYMTVLHTRVIYYK